MPSHVHVYPVDPLLSPEEAWREICLFGERVTDTGIEEWATLVCDGEECRNIKENNGAVNC